MQLAGRDLIALDRVRLSMKGAHVVDEAARERAGSSIGLLGMGLRIDDPKRLRHEITAWERQRNAARSRIKWMFTTDKARAKMSGAYPAASKES
jgi:hypothetical protein